MKRPGVLLITLLLLSAVGPAPPSQAALYWFQGVRDKNISVCFVGDAVTKRPDRVQQILDYIKEFEYAANIKFNSLGSCPAATPHPSNPSNDYYDGDIRVLIPAINVPRTGPVPGQGCPMFNQLGPGGYNGENDGRSWSNAPADLEPNRSCLYNLNLGDDPWNDTPYLNHTLHEFGHALGLSHEHARNDVNVSGCTEPGYGGSISSGFMTPYDRYSVMHYKFASCGINGNYDYTGLSGYDKLALHILYPEDHRVAEFVGTTVIQAGQALKLQSAWKARGANMDFVAHGFVWKLNGVTYSTTPDLVVNNLSPGDYTLEFAHIDFLNRSYTYSGRVRVLAPADYTQLVAAVVAANQVLFSTGSGGDTLYLPIVLK